MPERDDNIWIETMVSASTGEPFVTLRWYDHSGNLTPQEAREHALSILAAADACESDAFLVAFMKEHGMETQGVGVMLQAFRKYRDKREDGDA